VGRPEIERKKLLLLALEREQIVAVAYREEAVAGRVVQLDVGDTCVPCSIRPGVDLKDEQMHAEYLRGELLRQAVSDRAVVYGHQLQVRSPLDIGHLQSSPARTHPSGRCGECADLRAGVLGAFRPAPRRAALSDLRRYCELNIALESSAELAYRASLS